MILAPLRQEVEVKKELEVKEKMKKKKKKKNSIEDNDFVKRTEILYPYAIVCIGL
jgi:hypothetical protein